MSDQLLKRVHVDPVDRRYTFEHVQDVGPIVDANKALQSTPQKSDWGRHVACVPEVIVMRWLNEEYERGNTELRFLGPGFNEWFGRKIKDPDNSAWRVDNPANPFFIGYGK